VIARHLEEADEATALAVSLAENAAGDDAEKAVFAARLAAAESFTECALGSSAGAEASLPGECGSSGLIFDDDWMNEVPGQECARCVDLSQC
jgi:hypothetical protein